jgi:hypothetical protein
VRGGTDKISLRSYHVPIPEIRKTGEKNKGEEPMTNEKNRPEEQDLEISEEAADSVSGGVKAVEKLADADAAKVVTDPKLKADL